MQFILPVTTMLIFFVVVVFMMRHMVKNTSGWTDLEEKFKTEKQPIDFNSKNLKIRNCNFGGISTTNLFKFYDTHKGLLITQRKIVRVSKFNLLIPWSEFVESRERKLFFSKMYRLVIGDPFVSFIDLNEKDFRKIQNRVK